jgi:hypothetical protein
MEVTPTHYSILSCTSSQSAHPKSWCLEISGDGKSWTKVHPCENNSDLNGSSQIGIYSVNRPVKWRFVRLRQTRKNHLSRDCLRFSGFEIFGVLRAMRQSQNWVKFISTFCFVRPIGQFASDVYCRLFPNSVPFFGNMALMILQKRLNRPCPPAFRGTYQMHRSWMTVAWNSRGPLERPHWVIMISAV